MKSSRPLTETAIGMALFAVIAFASIGNAMEDPETLPVTEPLYYFSGRLLAELNKLNNGQENLVVSPISIHQALNIVVLGADDASQTERELLDTIGYSNMSNSDVARLYDDYSTILKRFSGITAETLAKRRDSAREGSRLDQPIIEMFNVMVVKNTGPVNATFERDIKQYFDASM
jgi:hypothetical protein